MTIQKLQSKVAALFKDAFGTTPTRQRLDDIRKEADELYNWTSIANLREEYGDLLSSVLVGIEEAGWDAERLLDENREKIENRRPQYKAFGRKINVAILGGAFNPITIGHIEVAKFVLETSKTFDEVWFVPCFNHMYNKELAAAHHRLEMCRIAARVDPRLKVFSYEIDHELGGETYHFCKKLLDEQFAKDSYDFSLIIGMDNANTFDKWVNYEDLERLMRFVVVPRVGEKADPKVTWYLNSRHIFLRPDHGQLPDTSSTMVRNTLDMRSCSDLQQRAEKLRSVRGAMNPRVLEYIKHHHLYNLEVPLS